MAIAAGNLSDLICIERRAATVDAWGQPADEWQCGAPIWADVRLQSGMEAIKAGAEVSAVRASIRIRYRNTVDAGMRVVHGEHVYNILAVLPDPAREFVDLVCEEVR